MGEDGTSSNNVSNNHAHHMNHNNNKSIPIRKMPAEYRGLHQVVVLTFPLQVLTIIAIVAAVLAG